VRKTENRFGFGAENTKPSKNLMSVRWLSNSNCVQSAIQIKSDKNNSTCIQCVQTKMKQCDCYGLLTAVAKLCYAQFILHSSNAVIFAVN